MLSNEYISAYCLQISLLVHAGINLADGLHLLAEDEPEGSDGRELLTRLAEAMDEGRQLSDAMAETGVFPSYVIHMAATGESTGRVEQAYRSMADYYEGQRQLHERIKSALVYPVVLLLLMLVIIGILLVKILPIFEQVYEQLGGSMQGLAGGLLVLGQGLGSALPILGVLVAVLAVVILIVLNNTRLKSGMMQVLRRVTGGWHVGRKVTEARFAAALSMGMMSGLPTEEALKIAASFQEENPTGWQRYEKCQQLLEEGETLADALRQAQVFDPIYCRMLALGVRSGTMDNVMEEIARRLDEDAQSTIEDLVSKVEPTIVIVTSLLVGIILVAVMLPLMNIMASIG